MLGTGEEGRLGHRLDGYYLWENDGFMVFYGDFPWDFMMVNDYVKIGKGKP